MYQEETYEPNDDEAREAAEIADKEERFEYEAAEAHARLWTGMQAMDYRSIAIGLVRGVAAESTKEAA